MNKNNKKRKLPSEPGKSTQSETRKLAQASRTLKACDICRKQKTRCFRSLENPNSCVRCHVLNKSCSFETFNFNQFLPEEGSNNKLELIYNGINEVLGILKNGTSATIATPISNSSSIDQQENDCNEYVDDNGTRFQSPPSSFLTSPYSIIQSQDQIPSPIQNLLISTPRQQQQKEPNVITVGILTEAEVIMLIDEFRREFGKWISLPPEIPTKDWINQINSSLLLTTCCCCIIMVGQRKNHISTLPIELVCQKFVQDLNQSIFKNSSYQSNSEYILEFLQSIVLLSTYSISISSLIQQHVDPTFNLDSWSLSQMGLTRFISSCTFGHLNNSEDDDDMILTQLRIYNHLCLTHLFSCMISGRMCILDEIRINQCFASLSLVNANNFDGRMVSEINMLVLAYSFIQMNNDVSDLSQLNQNLNNILQEIKLWYRQWEYLFSQPTIQFVELNYHFCNLLIYYGYEYHKNRFSNPGSNNTPGLDLLSDTLDELSLIEMFNHAYHVVKQVNDSDDVSFAYLSDQVHFCFYFAALCLIKILYQLENNEDKENGLGLIKVLIDKFTVISDSNNVVFRYKRGIVSCLQRYFP
ncbi:hypothetical protein JA1_004156 [Spathaspora sp. JA1]|nr:hypothetical protein JA1_004156 [Spathaspora sp. JA1]